MRYLIILLSLSACDYRLAFVSAADASSDAASAAPPAAAAEKVVTQDELVKREFFNTRCIVGTLGGARAATCAICTDMRGAASAVDCPEWMQPVPAAPAPAGKR